MDFKEKKEGLLAEVNKKAFGERRVGRDREFFLAFLLFFMHVPCHFLFVFLRGGLFKNIYMQHGCQNLIFYESILF